MNPFLEALMRNGATPDEVPPEDQIPPVDFGGDNYQDIPPTPEAQPQGRTIIPPNIQGSQDLFSPKGTVQEDYRNWLDSRPEENDAEHQSGTGRKILAGVLGFLTGLKDPTQGQKLTHDIATHGFDSDLADWRAQGKDLEPLAKAQESIGKVRREQTNDVLDYTKGEDQIKQQRERTAQMTKDAENRHQVALQNAKTAQDKAAAQKAYEKERNEIARENLKIESRGNDIKQQNADTESRRADTYTQDVRKGHYSGKDVRGAEIDATRELLTQNPDMEQYFQRSETNPMIVFPKEQLSFSSPEEKAKFDKFYAQIKKTAQQRLTASPFDVGEMTPGDGRDFTPLDQIPTPTPQPLPTPPPQRRGL